MFRWLKRKAKAVLPPILIHEHEWHLQPDSYIYVECASCGEEALYMPDAPGVGPQAWVEEQWAIARAARKARGVA